MAVFDVTLPVGPPPLKVTDGDPMGSKKFDGKFSVMLLPTSSLPPAVVVKEKVATATVKAETRWMESM